MRHVKTLRLVVSARNTFVIMFTKIIAEGTTEMRDVPLFLHRWQKLSQLSTHRIRYSVVTLVLCMRHVKTLGLVVSARSTFVIMFMKIIAAGTTEMRDVPLFVHRWQKLPEVSTHRLRYSIATPVLCMGHVPCEDSSLCGVRAEQVYRRVVCFLVHEFSLPSIIIIKRRRELNPS